MFPPAAEPVASLILSLITLSSLVRASEAAGSVFVYAGCSPSKFQPNSPYQSNLNSLFTSIAFSASRSAYSSYTTGAGDSTIYGLYQCRNDMSSADCSACVQSAVGQLSLVCAESYAASLQLDSCYVRYSNDNFLGRPDTSLEYAKCSASTTDDAEFFRRRDDVLGGLQAGTGFRVSGSGTVEGQALCLGDLSAADCTACLAEALAKLKNACGPAVAADVYLAQCYARYWASGYYLHDSKEHSEDDVGRTVAIAVGALAGFSLVVVILSFLIKACKLTTGGGDHVGAWTKIIC
ncbi:putative cysteine-rich repeat secretory protein 15 [Iris pallida]|uniref:Cysteine-rich repeat secretory protein 15 n=1 Tax=Iris pallida TaxID=29817 RepID=A0AAX6EMF9_IRIPA|nr:putative cysteine-rich repeat secretory protein 15 [Iris pallida]